MPLQSLRTIAEQLRPLGRHAVFYLAAAVSDFYIPWSQMVSRFYVLTSLTCSRSLAGSTVLLSAS